MYVNLVPVLLALLVSVIAAAEDKNEPMVAFLCNRPSMYRTERGWMKDDNTGCLRDPVDILNYCRKVFPHLDVRNVVESNEKVTINNWCAFGHKSCRHQFTVRPFRCLVGPFQSDALLVPEHCIFDHIHDSKLCTSYGEWNKTATGSCGGRNMHLQSFSMLQPCGIDRFNGVEFVCCPNVGAVAATEDSSSSEEDISDEVREDVQPKPIAQRIAAPTTTSSAPVTADDPFSSYMNRVDGKRSNGNNHKWNEHDYFVKAMEDMRRHHEDKINKMMKDWAAARQRVQELKGRDSKAAEKLNKEITARFQKTYDALEVENSLERKQLSNLHQQRVQSELNEKKRRALDDYMQTIDDNRDPAEILRTLKQYIKVVQKDRVHTINRYKHLRDTDPAEAEALRSEMADHLRIIDQQMTLALEMLDRVPKYKKKVQLQIDTYMDAYHAVDASVNVLMKSLVDNPPSTVTPVRDDSVEEDEEDAADEEEYGENEEEVQREEREEEENEEDKYEAEESEERNAEVLEPVEELEEENVMDLPVGKKVGGREDVEQVTVKPVVISVDDFKDKVEEADKSSSADADEDEDENEDDDEAVDNDKEEDEDYEDDDSKDDGEDDDEVITPADQATSTKKEYSVPSRELDMSDHDFLQDPEPAHVDKSYISVKEPYISKASNKGLNSFNAAVPIGITVGAITILVVILVGVVVMRRRASRRSLHAAVNVRLDPAASPEERHIAAMQMTGYENPTYKYFEQSSTVSA